MSDLRIEKVESEEYAAAYSTAPRTTIFQDQEYLQAAVDRYELYLVKKGDSVRGGASLILDERGDAVLDDLVIHNGPWFSIPPESKAVKARLEEFRILEGLIAELTRTHAKLELALHPGIVDVRPFLWYNYHEGPEASRFQADIRYTSFLDLRIEEASSDGLMQAMDTLRSRNIRESQQHDLEVGPEFSISEFVALYDSMMKEQGVQTPPEKLQRMTRLIEWLRDSGRLCPVQVRNPETGNCYIILMACHDREACYLFGTGTVNPKERFLGTRAFWEAFLALRERGIAVVDLEGINSPQRGWFKQSFGGDVRPYYEVALRSGAESS